MVQALILFGLVYIKKSPANAGDFLLAKKIPFGRMQYAPMGIFFISMFNNDLFCVESYNKKVLLAEDFFIISSWHRNANNRKEEGGKELFILIS
jgi:hypothetical protein